MKRKKVLITLGLVVYFGIIIGIIGYTYSYKTATVTNTGVISGTVASYELELSVSKVGNSGTGDLVPQLDSAITSAIKGTNGTLCLDGNGNTICQVYKIDVENLSNSAIDVYGYLDLNAGNNPNLKWAQVSGTSNPTLLSSVNPYSTVLLANADTINASSTKTYYIVLWISETGTAQSDTGSFTGVVTFTLEKRDYAKATLTKLGLNDSVNDTTPNFDSIATTNEGIYKADDDLGTSYYFRGAVDNNWVYFAGIYWRIIRINGDGSIRMIYSGTTAPTSSQAVVMTGSGTYVTTSEFNSSFNDNKYVGYTYDNNGTETDSTIKNYIENTWYANTLLNTEYEQYLADAIYCNDREVSTNSTVYSGWGSSYDSTSATLGQGTTPTLYKSEERLGNYVTPRSPSLKCSQESDKYTVSTSLGNGKLKYKVGLITADEIVMAGGKYNTSNTSFYLYTGSYYWTLTPRVFRGNYAYVWAFGTSNLNGYSTSNSLGVRLVVSLSSNVTISGNGSYSSPFTIS